MRRLGQALGVEAMSLYKHVANKDEVLDGIADLVMADVEVPDPDDDWRAALRRSAISAHTVLLRHPWASGVIESRRTAGPSRLRYLDAVIGTLARAGFSMPMIARAFMALDSHTYGFTMQELVWPFDMSEPSSASEAAASMLDELPTGAYPNLEAMGAMVMASAGGAPVDFEFGLDLILDGLQRLSRRG